MSKSKKRRPAEPAGDPIDLLEAAMAEAVALMEGRTWDWLLVGDGSGSGWDRACGWACYSLQHKPPDGQPALRIWRGAAEPASVNFAELLAYLQPVSWIANEEIKRRHHGRAPRTLSVHIITDSEYAAETGKRAGHAVASNAGIWAAFDSFLRQGIMLRWRWMRRESTALNCHADRLSKLARQVFAG